MTKPTAVSSTVHLHQQESTYPSAFFNLEAKASVNRGRSFTVIPKSPAFILGEQVLRPAIDNGYYYSCQLARGVRSVFSYIDAGLSKLFTIFPGVSAETVEPDETDITVLAKGDQNSEIARVKSAFTAYVASWPQQEGAGTVYAIDTSSKKIIANITVGRNPAGIAITPDSRYAYVTNYLDNTTSVIDTYTNTVFVNFAVGSNPEAIAITPDGRYAYVVNKDGTISVIETSINIVKTTIFASSSGGIAITPNGLYAYVASFFSNIVNVIETTNNTILTAIDVNSPDGVAITNDGLYAYVANLMENTVSVINTTSNAVIVTISSIASPSQVAITPDDLYAYVISVTNNSVSVIETTNNTVLTTIRVGFAPTAIAITSDGRYAYVTSEDSTISVINTANNAVIATIRLDNSHGSLLSIAITPAEIPTFRKDLSERSVRLLETTNKR